MIRRFSRIEGRYIKTVYGQYRLAFSHSDSNDLYDLVEWAERGGYPGSVLSFYDFETGSVYTPFEKKRDVLYGDPVYAGQVIGENPKSDDIEVNVCKTKHLTNTRASGSDEALKLVPAKIMSLEQCMDFIDTDELLEITPKSLRIRKKILDQKQRKRAQAQGK